MKENRRNDFEYLTSETLEKTGVRHLFTTRRGGVSKGYLESLNLGFSLGDQWENVLQNYQIVFDVLGICAQDLFPTKQVHEDTVKVVTAKDRGVFPPKESRAGCDAVITDERSMALAAFYADCPVALFYDPKTGVIGAAHAGWRGTVRNILAKTVQRMHEVYETEPEDVRAAFAPCIHACCFETDDDVYEALTEAYGAAVCGRHIERKEPKWHIDLVGLNRELLLETGMKTEHIDVSCPCTMCMSDKFWSHRKTGGRRGVQGAFIVLPPKEGAR